MRAATEVDFPDEGEKDVPPPPVPTAMIALVRLLRVWIRWLTTGDPSPGRIARLWRAALLVPAFGGVLVLLRLRLALAGPLTVTARTRFGAAVRCRLPDLIQMYIALFDLWEPDLTRLIGSRLGPGDVFVDVGANIGYYSLLASRCVGEAGGVVAIDASPANCAELQHNLASNPGTGNVRTLNRAAAGEHGRIAVYSGPRHNLGLATTAPGGRRGLRHETEVTAAPLAELLSAEETRRARLVKIDVEGSEPSVLAGIAGLLAAGRDDLELLVELSPAWWQDPDLTPEAVVRPLREAGFHSYLMDNDYWPWRYLWPAAVRSPRRVERLPDTRVKRLDLVFSRIDAPELPV